jgi:uncharacterized protein
MVNMSDITELFACTQCGFCCHGETTVSLDHDDQERMLADLELDRTTAARRYWKISSSAVQMKTVQGHCIFYQDGCTVYHGRPWRCRQWPLVPAILDDESNFIIIRGSCPGINQEISYERFKEILAGLIADGKISIENI